MVSINIIKQDISLVKADAIVNAANSSLWMRAGVAGALKTRGGTEIEREAISKGPIPVGNAIATKAGSLTTKYVIHAAVMGPNLKTDGEKIRRSTRNCLKLADELDLRSIAFPALGTGVGEFPTEECAKIMINEILDYESQKSGLKEAYLVLYDDKAYKIFNEELNLRLNFT